MIENGREAINKVFKDLKAKYKWSIPRLTWQECVTSEIRMAIKELANCRLRFGGFKELASNVMLICLKVKQDANKLYWCVKMVEY